MIEFTADNTRISGPKVDGTMSITFDVGEYQKDEVLEIMRLKLPLKVKVSYESTNKA
jgi:hypothetical protein